MFVSPNGELVPDKLQALVEYQEFDEHPGLLVFSVKKKWEDFSEMIHDGCYSEVLVLEGDDCLVIKNGIFDCVIFVKESVVESLKGRDFSSSQTLTKVNISRFFPDIDLECINIEKLNPREESTLQIC
jgi:hypothetical protein